MTVISTSQMMGDTTKDDTEADVPPNTEGNVWTTTANAPTSKTMPTEAVPDTTPFFWCRWVASRPKTCFVLTLLGHLAFIGVSLALYFTGYNILAFTFNDLPLEQMNDIMYRRHLALKNSWQSLQELQMHRQQIHDIMKRSTASRYQNLESISLIYDSNGENILSTKNLKKIKNYENHLYNLEPYQKLYCKNSKSSNQCKKFRSILRIFDGTYSHLDPAFNDTEFKETARALTKASEHPKLKDEVRWLIGSDFEISLDKTSVSASKLRSEINFGHAASFDDQMAKFEPWAFDYLLPEIATSAEQIVHPIKLYYWTDGYLYWLKIQRSVYSDMFLLLGAFAFIVLFTLLLTASLWITTWGILSILSSFLCANLIYNVGIGYKFFGIFNVLALFIVLGIAVDDIYIFYNCWKHLSRKHTSLEKILDECYRRAGFTILVTSVTTMVAFFVSSFSQILPISAFGTFAGLTVLINFISIMIFFPTVVAVYHEHFASKNFLCCSVSCPNSKSADLDVSFRYRDTSKMVTKTLKHDFGINFGLGETGFDASHLKVSHWFGKKYSTFVGDWVMRWVIVLVFLGLVVYMVYSLTGLRVDNTDIKILRPDNSFEVARSLHLSVFRTTDGEDPKMVVNLVWGVKPQDMSRCESLEYTPRQPCQGSTVWDRQFDINVPEAQTALVDLCERLSDMPLGVRSDLRLQDDYKKNRMKCIIKDFNDYLKTESTNKCYPAGTDLSLPMTTHKLQLLIDCHQDVFLNVSAAGFTRPFEIALQFWLNEVYHTSRTINKDDPVGFLRTGDAPLSRADAWEVHIYPARLQYLYISITTSARFDRMAGSQRVEMMENWGYFMEKELKSLPKTLQGGFQTCDKWYLLKTVKSIMTHGILGLGIGMAISIIFILIGTRNVITAFTTVLALAGIMTCVIGIIPLADWNLGILEGLNMCFVVGLAVDYSIHVAQGYTMSEYSGRKQRVQDCLQQVAIPILSGATTTLSASIFMLFCRIEFFMQFGIFMISTTGFSLIFSLLLLPAVLSICGPVGRVSGNFSRLCSERKSYALKPSESHPETYRKSETRF